jgi:hypothetical protein
VTSRSPEEIQSVLAEYRASGTSATKFARARQTSLSTLMNWLRRQKPAPPRAPRWVEVRPPLPRVASNSLATVRCADGLSMDVHPGFDPAPIAQLIRLLRQP